MSRPARPDAVARRMATLSAELAAVRDGEGLPRHGPVPVPVPAEEATRPRATPDDLERTPAPDPGPVTLPVPGRHAARRPRRGPRLPGRFSGRVPAGPATVAVVVLLVAAALGWLSWSLARAQAEPVLRPAGSDVTFTPSDAGAVDVSDPAVPGTSTEPAADPPLVVHVAGRVRRPGIVVLDPGARVTDAIEAAGGARRGARLSGLNLARLLVDGEQVLVGVPQPAGVAATAAPAGPADGDPGTMVDLNTAGAAELESLPEVGPVTAQAILGWRDEHGGFTSVDELLEVDGIGEKTLAVLAPFVTL